MAQQEHFSVLLNESIDGLNIKANGIYIDATFGRGGHSLEILKQLDPQGKLIAIDRDPQAAEFAKKFAEKYAVNNNFEFFHQNFANIKALLTQKGLLTRVDGILMDLGVSSPQLDQAERGFSFMQDGPLDMRMDTTQGLSAAEWLATADVEEIRYVLKYYGEEKFATRIAREIVSQRENATIETTQALVKIIEQATPVKDKFKHPATRSFQAIRIFINDELGELEKTLDLTSKILTKNGRLAVISFHSLEDRMVKRFIKEKSRGERLPKGLPIMDSELNKEFKPIGRAIKATAAEIKTNTRSRSAILRIAEKL